MKESYIICSLSSKTFWAYLQREIGHQEDKYVSEFKKAFIRVGERGVYVSLELTRDSKAFTFQHLERK